MRDGYTGRYGWLDCVVWVSPNGVWKIVYRRYHNGQSGGTMVVRLTDGFVDYPLLSTSGLVWNYPERVPAYVKAATVGVYKSRAEVGAMWTGAPAWAGSVEGRMGEYQRRMDEALAARGGVVSETEARRLRRVIFNDVQVEAGQIQG